MTVVIVGHDLSPDLAYQWLSKDKTKDKKIVMRPDGLFIAADSAITTASPRGRQVILSGFRKIYSIPIEVWKPGFQDVYFHSYREVYFRTECVVAIAGNTLTAQHVLNSITTHLSKLRDSYEREIDGAIRYVIIRHCAPNNLLRNPSTDSWADDMFTPNDYRNLMSGEVIVEAVEYSINEALTSARKYKIDPASFDSLKTEFALGFHCPRRGEHQLFIFRVTFNEDDQGVLQVNVSKVEVAHGAVAVLGMSADIEERAQSEFEIAAASMSRPSKRMFSLVNELINEEKVSGQKRIDRPSTLNIFKRGKLELIEIEAGD